MTGELERRLLDWLFMNMDAYIYGVFNKTGDARLHSFGLRMS